MSNEGGSLYSQDRSKTTALEHHRFDDDNKMISIKQIEIDAPISLLCIRSGLFSIRPPGCPFRAQRPKKKTPLQVAELGKEGTGATVI